MAHEFGHFAQATGMRITYIIRSINLWFERVVYEEDEWDERIRRWSREWDFRAGFVLLIARFFICITRRILWLLMLLGHAISGFLLRQMEYDADQYLTLLMGAEVFESTALEGQIFIIRDLRIAYEQLIVAANQLEDNQDDEKVFKQIRVKMEDVRNILGRLKRSLSSTPYPFHHIQARMTLGEFAVSHLPGKDELGPLLDAAYDAADKLFRVYARLVGRLAHLAELAENSSDPSPLLDPPLNS